MIDATRAIAIERRIPSLMANWMAIARTLSSCTPLWATAVDSRLIRQRATRPGDSSEEEVAPPSSHLISSPLISSRLIGRRRHTDFGTQTQTSISTPATARRRAITLAGGAYRQRRPITVFKEEPGRTAAPARMPPRRSVACMSTPAASASHHHHTRRTRFELQLLRRTHGRCVHRALHCRAEQRRFEVGRCRCRWPAVHVRPTVRARRVACRPIAQSRPARPCLPRTAHHRHQRHRAR